MNKIICDICGTKYPDTADQCPICGYANSAVAGGATIASEIEDNFLEDIIQEPRTKVKGGRFSRNNVRKRGVPVTDDETEEDEELDEETEVEDEEVITEEKDFETEIEEEEEEEEPRKKSGIFLNILLTLVILALLCVSGYIFVEYFMPNLLESKLPEAPTEPSTVVTEAPETEEPTVPCAELVLDETDIELTEIGQMYLLNVAVNPADTTDELSFASSNEAVVTVNEEGRVTVVGEGEATVTIVCGTQEITCSISVVLPTEEPTELPTEEATEAPTEETTGATEEPTEAPTEAPATADPSVKLEINGNTDVTFRGKNLTFTFKLKNGLKNEDVTWRSENEAVCTIDETGTLKTTGRGTTNVVVRYGDQEVIIIVRVKY